MSNLKTCGNTAGCVTGLINQDKSEFSKDSRKWDGLSPRCKSCHADMYAKRKASQVEVPSGYKGNREAKLAYQHAYYLKNKDKINESKRLNRLIKAGMGRKHELREVNV